MVNTSSEASEIIKSLCTLRDMIRWGASEFNRAGLHFGHGTANAWDDAAALVMHVLHLPHEFYAQALDTRLTPAERGEVLELLQERIQSRLPTPYLTHEAWFAGLSFYVDERVLIPRSPIVELIENQFSPWIEEDKVGRILDIGTGSACIAIACAQAFPDALVDAVDISSAALEVAHINVKKHHLEDSVRLLQSDVFAALTNEKYDLIVANPPYVEVAEMSELPTEYQHEPALALQAGVDGLDVVRRILADAAKYLYPHGILIVEVGQSADALQEAFPQVPFTWLDFTRSEDGVFVLTKDQLVEFANVW